MQLSAPRERRTRHICRHLSCILKVQLVYQNPSNIEQALDTLKVSELYRHVDKNVLHRVSRVRIWLELLA